MGARKATALKLIEGNRGKRRLPDEPKYEPLTSEPPAWLSREAKAEWRRVMRHLGRIPGLLQYPDRGALIAMCTEWDRYIEATKDIARRGVQVEGMSRGEVGMVKNPSVQVARESLQALLVLWSRFGMTPADRSRVQGPPKGAKHDPLEDILD